MTAAVTGSIAGQAALAWLEGIGCLIRNGGGIAPGESAAERSGGGETTLAQRLREALTRLAPDGRGRA